MAVFKWQSRFPFARRSHCPFCAQTRFEFFLAYDDVTVMRCACGYVFMNPYLSEQGSQAFFSGDVAAEFPWLVDYEKVMDQTPENSKTFKAYGKALDLLEKKKPQKGRLLDIGCGSGHFLGLARQRGWPVEGLDFDAKSAFAAAQRCGGMIREGRLQDAGFQTGSFDVITLWDYFEHVEDPAAILTQVRRLLAPAGILVIACPNHKSLLFGAALFLSKMTRGKFFCHPLRLLYPITHLSYFDPDFLSRQLPAHGFVEFARRYDETDLRRIRLNPVLKLFVAVLFAAGRFFRLTNRFNLFLEKQNDSDLQEAA